MPRRDSSLRGQGAQGGFLAEDSFQALQGRLGIPVGLGLDQTLIPTPQRHEAGAIFRLP